jgi:hypothetical protein
MSNFLQLVRVRLALSLTLSDKPRIYLEESLLGFQAQIVCSLFLRVHFVQLYSDVQEVLSTRCSVPIALELPLFSKVEVGNLHDSEPFLVLSRFDRHIVDY